MKFQNGIKVSLREYIHRVGDCSQVIATRLLTAEAILDASEQKKKISTRVPKVPVAPNDVCKVVAVTPDLLWVWV